MKRYSCIIFDLDGTLTKTNELIFASFNIVTEKYLQKTYSPAEITALFGPPEEIAIEKLVGKERTGEALDDFFTFYESQHSMMASAYHGITELLKFLKNQGVLLAIFTGKGSRSARITLEQIGIIQHFDMIVSGTDVVKHKPSGEGIQKVIDTFGLNPEEVLMVGDAVSDVKAARETGVDISSVVWDSYAKEQVLQMQADYIFHTVEEFDAWMRARCKNVFVKTEAEVNS